MPKPKQVINKWTNPQTIRTGIAILGTLGVGAVGTFNPQIFDAVDASESTLSLAAGIVYTLLKLLNRGTK